MRAVVVTRFGGPEVLEVREEPDPVAGPNDLLVAAEAIGVNYRDIYEREGRYGGEAPLINGVEGAGTVPARAVGRATGRVAGGAREATRNACAFRPIGRCRSRTTSRARRRQRCSSRA